MKKIFNVKMIFIYFAFFVISYIAIFFIGSNKDYIILILPLLFLNLILGVLFAISLIKAIKNLKFKILGSKQ